MVKMRNSGIEIFVEERDIKRFESMGYSIFIEELPINEAPVSDEETADDEAPVSPSKEKKSTEKQKKSGE